MGYHSQNGIFCHKSHHLALFLIILLISTSSHFRLFSVEGRKLVTQQPTQIPKAVNIEEKRTILRAQIGSRPPRCERRCISCGHCEAIQVPTNPQTRRSSGVAVATVTLVGYGRGEGSANYKPMSWKCKCGNLIFNP